MWKYTLYIKMSLREFLNANQSVIPENFELAAKSEPYILFLLK